jgi:hypothetical protein
MMSIWKILPAIWQVCLQDPLKRLKGMKLTLTLFRRQLLIISVLQYLPCFPLTLNIRRGFWQYKDNQTHHDCLAQLHAKWSPIIADLADAYMAWKARGPSNPSAFPLDACPSSAVPSDHGSDMSMSSPVSPSKTEDTPCSPGPDVAPFYNFDIAMIDIYTLRRMCTIHRTSEMKTAVALMNYGLLLNVPFLPLMALSLMILELYCRLWLWKPSFNVEAFTKVVCDLYMVA